MTEFVETWQRAGMSVTSVIAEWDGRPTAALLDADGESWLLWLLWDHAPRFEVWVSATLSPKQTKSLRSPTPPSLASFFTNEVTDTSLTVFNPVASVPEKQVLLTFPWRIPPVKTEELAIQAAAMVAEYAAKETVHQANDELRTALGEVATQVSALAESWH
ncbi:hypothetical protein [Streptomyces sp. NBC_00140]|uniref:hypothetical protein n=1 Tax=Streptomyces sp. NBC_00140 TaxID=2975664 RepID=UPI0022500B67|nr:hypothetical protein [Streptomyces sp. NBC_00140]MCX5332095.1 hypothetical protein [Streptomyces sp. NBC_00140]